LSIVSGVVGHQLEPGDTEVEQNLRPDIGASGSLRLRVRYPAASSLAAAQVHHHTAPGIGDPVQRPAQLAGAVTAEPTAHVTGQTFGLHPNEHILRSRDVALHEGHVLSSINAVDERISVEGSPWRRDRSAGHT